MHDYCTLYKCDKSNLFKFIYFEKLNGGVESRCSMNV